MKSEPLTEFLARVAQRIRRDSMVAGVGTCTALVAGSALLYQILSTASAPAGLRFAVVAAASLVVLATLFALRRTVRTPSPTAAANAADARADLHDALKSAQAFSALADPEPLMVAQIARAGATTRALAAEHIVPARVPRSAIVAALLVCATAVWPFVDPPLRQWLVARNRVAAPSLSALSQRSTAPPAASVSAGARDSASQQQIVDRADRTDGSSDTGPTAGSGAPARAAATSGAARPGAGGAGAAGSIMAGLRALMGGDGAAGGDADARPAPSAAGARSPDVAGPSAGKEELAGLAQRRLVATGTLDILGRLSALLGRGDEDNADPHGEVARSLRQANLKPPESQPADERSHPSSERPTEDDSRQNSVNPAVSLTPQGQRDQGHGDGGSDRPQGNARLDASDSQQAATQSGEGDAKNPGGSDDAESKGSGPAPKVQGERTTRLATRIGEAAIRGGASADGSPTGLDRIYAATRGQPSLLDYRTVSGKTPASRADTMQGEHVPLEYRNLVRDYFLAARKHQQ